MLKIADFFEKQGLDSELRSIAEDTLVGFKEIMKVVQTVPFTYSEGKNSSGETQLSHDILADVILHDVYLGNDYVKCFVSEERDTEICFIDSENAPYKVAFDPLDGSSVAAHNVSVGTSVGIYKGGDGDFLSLTGRDMAGAMYAVYGPRLLVGLCFGKGVHLFRWDEEVENFVLEKENMKLLVDPSSKVASFGGLQKSCSIEGFPDLILNWQKEGFKMRYTGSMATDLNAILMRGGGIFTYPYAKLRKLYECNPFGFIIEQAGGMAIDLKGNDILDLKVDRVDDAVEIILGTKIFVDKAGSFLIK